MKANDEKQKVIAIIPAYEPPQSFIEYAKEILSVTDQLIVVNDGSGSEYDQIFNEIEKLPRTEVLVYGENRGKGHALKQALFYCFTNYRYWDIVVTADCDGQHTPSDVARVAAAVEADPEMLVLGSRDFTGESVPKRSYAGNTNMRRILDRFFDLNVSDTQTGLRAFSVLTAKDFMDLSGERFEYETHVLIYSKKKGIPIREVKIDTVYPSDAKDHVSHFRTIRDSIPIARIILKNANLRVLIPSFMHNKKSHHEI